MITSLNHITISVSNVETSFKFYVELLGMKPHALWNNGAYLTVGDLWFCLSQGKVTARKDYNHLAFSVNKNQFRNVKNKLKNENIDEWKNNSSEGYSIYFLDPDGHKLEIHSGSLESRLESLRHKPYEGLELFD